MAYEEMIARSTAMRKQKAVEASRNKGGGGGLLGNILGGVVGFLTGGPAGAVAGWKIGGGIGKGVTGGDMSEAGEEVLTGASQIPAGKVAPRKFEHLARLPGRIQRPSVGMSQTRLKPTILPSKLKLRPKPANLGLRSTALKSMIGGDKYARL